MKLTTVEQTVAESLYSATSSFSTSSSYPPAPSSSIFFFNSFSLTEISKRSINFLYFFAPWFSTTLRRYIIYILLTYLLTYYNITYEILTFWPSLLGKNPFLGHCPGTDLVDIIVGMAYMQNPEIHGIAAPTVVIQLLNLVVDDIADIPSRSSSCGSDFDERWHGQSWSNAPGWWPRDRSFRQSYQGLCTIHQVRLSYEVRTQIKTIHIYSVFVLRIVTLNIDFWYHNKKRNSETFKVNAWPIFSAFMKMNASVLSRNSIHTALFPISPSQR